MATPEYVFVGSYVPKGCENFHSGISFAGNNYQHRVLAALNCRSFSIVPLFSPWMEVQNHDNVKYSQFKFKWKGAKLLLVFFDFIRFCFGNKSCYVFYNIEPQNILLILYAKYFLRSKVIIILADYLASKSLFGRIVQYLLNSVTGVLCLREGLLVNQNNAVMVGLIDNKTSEEFPVAKEAMDLTIPDKFVLYSGSIGWVTGLELFFQLANRCADVPFVVTGKPFQMSEKALRDLFDKNCREGNVTFLGAIESDVYDSILKRSTCILSMRDPSKEEHKGNFPSKIIEALVFGKPLISTMAYSELPSDVYIPCNYEPQSIDAKIKLILSGEVLISEETQKQFLRAECSGEALVEKLDLLIHGGS